MKTLTKTILYFALMSILLMGCKETPKNQEPENQETFKDTVEVTTKITIEKLKGSLAYKDASLKLNPSYNSQELPSGEVNFQFNVENYELSAQTEGENSNRLANSGKGQHIHFILNNEPYSAHYVPEFTKEIPDGVHHLVAFLSRSYHESVKNKNSVVVKRLEVGKNPVDSIGLDMEAPTLIYSRPKGEYVGKDTENLLLDFFVLNTMLSESGNKVRATINKNEFIITEWAPYVINGLPMGPVDVELELIDASGNLIPGLFNKVHRTVILKR